MKKLALVIVLTVLATRYFSRDHRPPGPPVPPWTAGVKLHRIDRPAPTPGPMVAIQDPATPQPPSGLEPVPPPDGPIRIVPGPPPEGPSPEEPIRVIPWKGSGPVDRSRRLAVPIAPKADPTPPWFPRTDAEEAERAKLDDSGARVLLGRLSATPERARADLGRVVEAEVVDWLASDISGSWRPPASALAQMALASHVQAVTRSFKPTPGEPSPDPVPPDSLRSLDDFYTLYRAGQRLDFSPDRRAALVELYRQDAASWRMRWLGVAVAVILAVLAIVSTYIRADEATKGYYTNRLRASALAGLAAAGAAAYYVLA